MSYPVRAEGLVNMINQFIIMQCLHLCKKILKKTNFAFSLKNYLYNYPLYPLIGLMGRVFTNGLQDQVSIPGQVIAKTHKTLLDTNLLNSQHHKIWIKGKRAIQEKEKHPLLHLSVVAIEKGAFRSPTLLTYWMTPHIYI